ncbi:MAG: glucose dehydrogenase, partial [Chloroflexota bacterium]|nr:glucose dehydrogenase [Chloroflexota bacterium]
PSRSQCDQAGLEPPVIEYGHDLGCSITGGHVYRGARLPGLAGAYVYGDYCSGRIWAVRYDGSRVTGHALLSDTDLRISSFGVDEAQELHILAWDGRIYRLAP